MLTQGGLERVVAVTVRGRQEEECRGARSAIHARALALALALACFALGCPPRGCALFRCEHACDVTPCVGFLQVVALGELGWSACRVALKQPSSDKRFAF